MTELSLDDNLRILETQRENIACLEANTKYADLDKMDELISRLEGLKGQSVDDKILIGSLVDVEIIDFDGDIDINTLYLGLDISGDSISVISPLGFALLGRSVGETVSYSVATKTMQARIIAKNNYYTNENDREKTYAKN